MRVSVLIAVLLATSTTFGSRLFDDDQAIDITLRGPLSTVVSNKRSREEQPFSLTVNDTSISVAVRIRGKSRIGACSFPPLRLNFKSTEQNGTLFAGEDKLKLVSHCQNGSDRSQDSVLNEYAAYRIFNLISEWSYRVRLLRIRYEDTDGKQRRLDQPHFGFLIESDESLASRLGGNVANLEAIKFSKLDALQIARLNVFQFLIGNSDWSLVKAIDSDTCCHNIDLINTADALLPIPYDFDLAAMTRAKYRRGGNLNQSTRRKYSGYCKTSANAMNEAIDQVQLLADDILTTAQAVPAMAASSKERRVAFITEYFDKAADKDSLLAAFRRTCVG